MNAKADVLIVTVTKVESQAVLELFKEVSGNAPQPKPIGDRVYHDLGEINRTRVFMGLSEMGSGGLGASQQAVEKGIAALKPSSVIMVGIAFGVNEEKQAIGDVLVSQQLRLYELQRVGRVGTNKIILRGDKPHASTWLLNYLKSADLYLGESKPKVRFGVVLTGEKLVDNVDYRDELKTFEPEAIGGEMEGAGLYVACQDGKVDWILVKAICDWADGHKATDEDQRQHLAARNAASFVLHALQMAPLKPEPAPTLERQRAKIQPSTSRPRRTPNKVRSEEMPASVQQPLIGETGDLSREAVRTPENEKPPILNPYDYTHPVTKARFYGRQRELERLTSVILAGKSVVIYGLQRMGKTSLVEEALELAKDQIASRFVVLPIDMFISYTNLNSYFDLFVTILDALWENLGRTDYAAYKDAQRHYIRRHSDLAELQRGFIDLLSIVAKVLAIL